VPTGILNPLIGDCATGAEAFKVDPSAAAPTEPAAVALGDAGFPDWRAHAATRARRRLVTQTRAFDSFADLSPE
jgi:hypothetical protein